MQRLLLCFAVAALAAATLGCPLPQTGLDYCSPTVDQNGVPLGGFNMRQGSVLGGMPGVPVYAQPQPTLAQGVPTPAQGGPTPAGQPTLAQGVPTPAAQPTVAGSPTPAGQSTPVRWTHGAQPASATMPVTADPDEAELAE